MMARSSTASRGHCRAESKSTSSSRKFSAGCVEWSKFSTCIFVLNSAACVTVRRSMKRGAKESIKHSWVSRAELGSEPHSLKRAPGSGRANKDVDLDDNYLGQRADYSVLMWHPALHCHYMALFCANLVLY